MSGAATFLACIIFPLLSALGHYFINGHIAVSGGWALFENQCPPNGSGPFSAAYTGVPLVDGLLCIAVGFFSGVLHPSNLALIAEFFASYAPLLFLVMIESSRKGRSSLYSQGLLLVHGLVYQSVGLGIAFHIFWLALPFSGHNSIQKGSAKAKVTQLQAEANLFAVVVGYVLPNIAMYVLDDPWVTVASQAFPVWVALLRGVYLFLASSVRKSSSGYSTTQFAYVLFFLASAAVHVTILRTFWDDLDTLKYQFIPRITAPSSNGITADLASLVFMQWDMYFTMTSSILGTFWFTTFSGQRIALMAWYTIVTPILGPGASIAGALIWRERQLNKV